LADEGKENIMVATIITKSYFWGTAMNLYDPPWEIW